jgi:hypothetical protein
METSRQTNVIPFPQIKGDRSELFGQALAEEFFEDLDALFKVSRDSRMHEQHP